MAMKFQELHEVFRATHLKAAIVQSDLFTAAQELVLNLLIQYQRV